LERPSVQDAAVAVSDIDLVQGGVGREQRIVACRHARVDEDATDADGAMNPTETDSV
jgi:hypothetical protein